MADQSASAVVTRGGADACRPIVGQATATVATVISISTIATTIVRRNPVGRRRLRACLGRDPRVRLRSGIGSAEAGPLTAAGRTSPGGADRTVMRCSLLIGTVGTSLSLMPARMRQPADNASGTIHSIEDANHSSGGNPGTPVDGPRQRRYGPSTHLAAGPAPPIAEPLWRRWRPRLRNPAGNRPGTLIAEPLCRRRRPRY